ncbi:hypothetical protein TTHERM_00353430 (macronuclear) [Tetrahymena thermophila SB210]|uniref:Uncharacterized protein n=1 Tax=Tetrahymena thermophila (strain SB210) TaxID=312017 RepID=I7M9U9_TETTS|nr:hypothetical protein TTHERM_00353430 [Tetrahymena thermophila SB210]EAS02855.2 hypothetical protein TTHERM_00353430 [Tetrahymena thermophila SB210]|eukprot:XP_001023100.2 hypothetical protein TTHERM_00353430 [Tetrahymena thermophila SB210]
MIHVLNFNSANQAFSICKLKEIQLNNILNLLQDIIYRINKMKQIIQIIFIFIQLILFIECKKYNLFLDQEVHDIDPLSLADEDIGQEYNHLNITRTRQYLVVENIDDSQDMCWSFFLEDFIDLDLETENRFVRAHFQKLNNTSTFNVIGLESIEHNKFKRIFIKQDGQIGYAYSDEKLISKSDEKILIANTIPIDFTFKWSQGDTIQIFYFAEEKQILLYNQNKDNLFKFSESLIDKLGRKFKIFIGISSFNNQVILSNYLS